MESGEAEDEQDQRRTVGALSFSHAPRYFYFFFSFFYDRPLPPTYGLTVVSVWSVNCMWLVAQRVAAESITDARPFHRQAQEGVILQRVERLENIAKVSEA